jgi:hypothetical protein
MTLDQIMEHGKEAASHLFKEQGVIHPMWICECENGEMLPICIQMPEGNARDAVASALKDTFRRHRVVRYVALLEAWVVEMPADTDVEKLNTSRSFEHHPDRREAVFVQAEDIDGSQRAGQFYILRPEHGKPSLSEFKDFGNQDNKPSEGRFARLLSMEE